MEINPWGQGHEDETMDIEEEDEIRNDGQENTISDQETYAWGNSLKHLKSLQELEISLETSDDRIAQLEAIVKAAQEWKFPVGENKVASTSTRGMEVARETREGPVEAWSDFCAYCCGKGGDADACLERRKRRMEEKGPVLKVARLTWSVSRLDRIS